MEAGVLVRATRVWVVQIDMKRASSSFGLLFPMAEIGLIHAFRGLEGEVKLQVRRTHHIVSMRYDARPKDTCRPAAVPRQATSSVTSKQMDVPDVKKLEWCIIMLFLCKPGLILLTRSSSWCEREPATLK